jgi:hypothetical protein
MAHMIEPADVTERLVRSARSICPTWQEHVASEGQGSGHYIDVAAVARHVVGLARSDDQKDLSAVFAEVEDLLSGEQLSPDA